MKLLHRPDLFGWTIFDEDRNIDFHSVLWVREEGNIAIDPLPLSEHDKAHLKELGPLQWIIITNSDHVRDAAALAESTGAVIAGPAAERDSFPVSCERWLSDGDSLVPGLEAIELNGSKTPGELALLLEETTLISGDLIRAHAADALCLLPDKKIVDRQAVIESVKRIAGLPKLDAVLTGDGWPIFRGARDRLRHLLDQLEQ